MMIQNQVHLIMNLIMNLAINLLNIKSVFKYCGFNRVWLKYNHTLLNP